MKRIVTFLFLLFSVALFAQDLQQPVPKDPSVKIGTLPNGLTYYIKNNAYPKNSVELRLAINAGSILETDSQQGLAHFMEHMNFNGTKKFPKNELVSFLQSLGIEFGADLNAYTSFDETVYMLPVPTDKEGNFEKGMDVIEDWAFNATLDGDEIDNERGVILEEKLARTSADSRMWNRWLPKVFAGSKYANRLPIGTDENLKTFAHDEIRKFHNDWYRPNLMAVIIVGDIDVAVAEKAIIDRFSKYQNPENAPKRETFDVLPHQKALFVIESDPEAMFTNVDITYIDKEKSHIDVSINDYRNMLIDNLFSQIINNRFDEIANGTNPPFNYAYSYHGGTFSREREAFQSGTMTSPEQLKEAIKVLLTENERVQQHGFVQSELDRAKADLLSNMEKTYNNRDKRESSRMVDEYIGHFLNQELIPSLEWEYEQYQKLIPEINLDEVGGLISKYIHEDPAIVITSQSASITEAELEQIVKEVNASQLEPYKDSAAGLTLMKETPKKGKISKKSKADANGVVTYQLANGAKVVYMKTTHKNDEILFKGYSYGGLSLISDDLYKSTKWALNGLSDAGVNGLSLNDLTKVMSGKSVNVNPSISQYEESLGGSSSNKDFETLFQLIHSYFTGLNKDEAAYQSYVQKTRGMYDNIYNNPEIYYYNEWNNFLSQNDPRKGNILPKAEDWDVTSYDKAYDLYKQRFANPGDFTFIFVGSIDESKITDYVETYIASLAGNKKLKENYKPRIIETVKGGTTQVYKKGSEDKVMVSIQYQTPTVFDKKENLQFKMLNSILEIKLTENLREGEGGVYSLRANAGINRVPSVNATLSIGIPTSIDKYQKMIEMSAIEVQKIIDNGPSETDLNKTKETYLNDYKENIQTNRFWLSSLYESNFFKEDFNSIKNYEAEVGKVTTTDIQNVAKKYLSVKPNIGILLPEKEIKKDVIEQVAVSSNVSANDIIGKYLVALSGKPDVETATKELNGVKMIKSSGTMKIQGMEMKFNNMEEVNKLTSEMNMMGQKMVQVFSPEGSYVESNGQKQDLPAEMAAKYTDRKTLFDQAMYQQKTLTLKESIKVNGVIQYVIEVKDANGTQLEYYTEDTGMLVKIIDEEGTTELSSYKEFNGILCPMVITQTQEGQKFDVNVETYEIVK